MKRAAQAFYVMAPIGVRTGGPEALHQLVDAIRKHGAQGFIVPSDGTTSSMPVPDYARYDYEIAPEIPRSGACTVVLPENRLLRDISGLAAMLSADAKQARIWWLSVDNSGHRLASTFAKAGTVVDVDTSLQMSGARAHQRLVDAGHRLGIMREGHRVQARLRRLEKFGVRHIAQSAYAEDFCKVSLGQQATLVTDYLAPLPDFERRSRNSRLVMFNGSKGAALIPSLQALLPDVTFAPIAGMSYAEVCSALASASAYVELGNLPGRDRLPREAGRLGTPVVLLKRGAGRYRNDFPLPDVDTVNVDGHWEQATASALGRVLDDHGAAVDRQSEFRDWVLDDHERFDREVLTWLESDTAT